MLEEPSKPPGGCRHYFADMAKRIRFIKRAQALGFTLDEILILLRHEGAECCADTRKLAAQKLALIECKLADLKAMREALEFLLHQCGTGDSKAACPFIQALAEDQSKGSGPALA